MDTCFLFTKHLDDQGCFCLTLTPDGTLTAPALQRSFAQIQTLQRECKTWVVESCDQITLIDLELPWLSDRKARLAIPYALEDKLAQPVESLHFAFDKQRYQNHHYLISVISKLRMQYIMQLLIKEEIAFDGITVDWFALNANESCLSENTLLVNESDFKGSLSADLATTYRQAHPFIHPLAFQDSQTTADLALEKKDGDSFTWIAQRLLQTKPLDLCQGEMQHGNDLEWVTKGYQLFALLCVFWLLSLVIIKGLTLHSLNQHNQVLDDKIAIIYHDYFPDAKQVISPKFRISQLIGAQSAGSQTHFWFLIDQLATAIKENPLLIEQLRYQNKTVLVTLESPDFAQLERLEKQLTALKLKVKQNQASTRGSKVVATLELM